MVFSLDGRRYALHLSVVQQVVRMVAVSPLPKAPGIVLGVVNFHGQIIPVLDVLFIHDLDAFLTPDEDQRSAEALEGSPARQSQMQP